MCVILKLYTEFQSPTICLEHVKNFVLLSGVRWVGRCKPILVFSFGQAEQYTNSHKYTGMLTLCQIVLDLCIRKINGFRIFSFGTITTMGTRYQKLDYIDYSDIDSTF